MDPFAEKLHLSGGAKSRSSLANVTATISAKARPRLPPLNNDSRLVRRHSHLLNHCGLQQVHGTRRGVGLRRLSEDTGSLEVCLRRLIVAPPLS